MSRALIGSFSALKEQDILVAGDLMLDTYTIGKARRISPEAPVAIVQVEKDEQLPGGAGNVLLNLSALGVKARILARVGADHAGDTLIALLKNAAVSTEGVLISKSFQTPVKNRIVSDSQQIVRIDRELPSRLTEEEEKTIIEAIPSLVSGVKLIALSDYGKGFLTHNVLKALIAAGRKAGIPVIADPKGVDFAKYSGVTLLKPNLAEAYAAAKAPLDTPIESVANQLLRDLAIDYLMITRSQDGISLFCKNGTHENFPVRVKEVKDVTGAGDTVLATLAFCLANNLPLTTSIQFSNIAAGIAIEHFGCAQVCLSDLAKRVFELDLSNKIFDLEHMDALRSALDGTECYYALLSGDEMPHPDLIQKMVEFKQTVKTPLIGLLKNVPASSSILTSLSALFPIDYLLLNTTPEDLLKRGIKLQLLK